MEIRPIILNISILDRRKSFFMMAKASKLSSGLIAFSFRFAILMSDAGEVHGHYRFQLDYRDSTMTDCRAERALCTILRHLSGNFFPKHSVLYLHDINPRTNESIDSEILRSHNYRETASAL